MKFGTSVNNYNYAEVNFYESTAVNMYNFVGYAAYSMFFVVNIMKIEVMVKKRVEKVKAD